MQDDKAADTGGDESNFGMVLVLTFQGVIWLTIGLLLGRVFWGPAL